MDVWATYAAPAAIFLATVFAGYLLRRILFNRLTVWSEKSKTQIDNIILDGVRKPSMVWFVMLGLYLATQMSPVPDNAAAVIGKILLALGILSVTVAAANIVGRSVRSYSGLIDTALPVTSLTQNIARIIIFIIGILMVLQALGVSITPILASLGIGGLAVALALQDTLANFFAGFHIIVSRQIRVGDYIKLDTGEQGYVIDINWRMTQIRTLPNHVVLVPNSKLGQAIVLNYYMPDKEIAVLVEVGVHYNSDLKHVERVTCEVGEQVMKTVTGGVPTFKPFIRYHTFGDFSIGFTVILRAKEFVDQYLIKHEFVKALHESYAKEGINIPYPIRAINYDQEKAAGGS